MLIFCCGNFLEFLDVENKKQIDFGLNQLIKKKNIYF